MGTALHVMFAFLAIGVLFNLVARPDSWTKFLSGTLTSLTGLTSGIAGIR